VEAREVVSSVVAVVTLGAVTVSPSANMGAAAAEGLLAINLANLGRVAPG